MFLAVPDGAVAKVAAQMARRKLPGAVGFVHVSGALGLDVLTPLSPHDIGSFHPLQSFPAPRPPEAFHGITVAVDASSTRLEKQLAQLARDIGGRPRHVGDAERALYHAAAVFASNYVTVVVAEATKILETAGWSRDEAAQALVPLVEGALANIKAHSAMAALTGPVRRGDADTVGRHLTALKDPDSAQLYRMLGLFALEIAIKAGLEPAAAGRTRRALTRKVAATRRRGRG